MPLPPPSVPYRLLLPLAIFSPRTGRYRLEAQDGALSRLKHGFESRYRYSRDGPPAPRPPSSNGQDTTLSRWEQGFDSPWGHGGGRRLSERVACFGCSARRFFRPRAG